MIDKYSVDTLNLSDRVNNILAKIGVHSVGQLVQLTELNLYLLPGMGAGGIKEIRDKLALFNLSLKELDIEKLTRVQRQQLMRIRKADMSKKSKKIDMSA